MPISELHFSVNKLTGPSSIMNKFTRFLFRLMHHEFTLARRHVAAWLSERVA